jgi:hypothetical protein
MIPIPFASFLAGAILSLVMPAGLLVVVTLWYHFARKRMAGPPAQTPGGSTTARPPADNPAQPS